MSANLVIAPAMEVVQYETHKGYSGTHDISLSPYAGRPTKEQDEAWQHLIERKGRLLYVYLVNF